MSSIPPALDPARVTTPAWTLTLSIALSWIQLLTGLRTLARTLITAFASDITVCWCLILDCLIISVLGILIKL